MGKKAKPPVSTLAGGFAVCGFTATLASYLEICKRHRLTPVGVGPKIPELDFGKPNFEGSRASLASLFSFV
jgi:hypothetical protein